jgi:hypothetical protein
MMSDDFPANTLVGVTTYAGGLETRLILKKALRHFRWRNGRDVSLLVVSDGALQDPGIQLYADHVLARPKRSGLQEGELESLRQMVEFAEREGFRYLVKIGGDVIMNRPDWVSKVVSLLRSENRRILSTHWFENDSWVVGTKFFAAEVAFLREILPDKMDAPLLETVFTESIKRHYPLEEVAYLINSNTGEANEVENELEEWQWEHAHSLTKFRNLDADAGTIEKTVSRGIHYPALRFLKNLSRAKRKSSAAESLEFRG